MTATAEMLYNLQRFQILSLYKQTPELFEASPAYAFAWDRGVFPIIHEQVTWHEPYAAVFQIDRDKVDQLSEFLDDLWSEGKTISFYELEDHYELRGPNPGWDRADLIGACRYLRLCELFDDSFWSAVVENMKCPGEAKSIIRPFNASELHLV
ncbi:MULTISPECIES: hypothetical protein [Pseudomonas]|uniref:hypothetical protein n=1 Tax=Pseudomonas TaxID=286 RepID=UPI000697920C|nr:MULTISPECIES: hypothetical protein [Pseudomonas]